MNFNFELILFYATIIAGIIGLADLVYFEPRRKAAAPEGAEIKMPLLFDYARSFFPVLLLVFLLRSFLFEPFRIPSGSLEPTLLKGDFILVNKFDYGVRLPVIHTKLFGDGEPKRGDIMVFRWPPNPSYDFIKRVIGVPGDKISYINKELTVNGQPVSQTYLHNTEATDEVGGKWDAVEKQEDLLGIKHNIFIDSSKSSRDFKDVVVPPGMYFVMGDNRDDSADSRYWGFVPEANIVGKAVLVWMSWNSEDKRPRFERMGKIIH